MSTDPSPTLPLTPHHRRRRGTMGRAPRHVRAAAHAGEWPAEAYHEYQQLAAGSGNVDSARLLLECVVGRSTRHSWISLRSGRPPPSAYGRATPPGPRERAERRCVALFRGLWGGVVQVRRRARGRLAARAARRGRKLAAPRGRGGVRRGRRDGAARGRLDDARPAARRRHDAAHHGRARGLRGRRRAARRRGARTPGQQRERTRADTHSSSSGTLRTRITKRSLSDELELGPPSPPRGGAPRPPRSKHSPFERTKHSSLRHRSHHLLLGTPLSSSPPRRPPRRAPTARAISASTSRPSARPA